MKKVEGFLSKRTYTVVKEKKAFGGIRHRRAEDLSQGSVEHVSPDCVIHYSHWMMEASGSGMKESAITQNTTGLTRESDERIKVFAEVDIQAALLQAASEGNFPLHSLNQVDGILQFGPHLQ